MDPGASPSTRVARLLRLNFRAAVRLNVSDAGGQNLAAKVDY